MAIKCMLKSIDSIHEPIVLQDNSKYVFGRNKITKIKDRHCSKTQLEFLADYKSKQVFVKQLGPNLSFINGKPLTVGSSQVLNEGDVLEILENKFLHEIKYDMETYNSIKLADDSIPTKRSVSPKESFSKKQKLLQHWNHYENDTLYVYNCDVVSKEKIASYDLDGTLITTSSGKVFPTSYDDWKILYSEIPGNLKKLYSDGFKIVIFTNQAGIAYGKQTSDGVKQKLEKIANKLGVPVQIFVSPGKGKYRKPYTGMWNFLEKYCNEGICIDHASSFYVGDAAGRPELSNQRKKDHSCSDRLFALNLGVKFLTPEEHFLGKKPQKFVLPEFDPRNVDASLPLFVPTSTQFPKHKKEIAVLVGYPGSGKSFLCEETFAKAGFVIANRDTLGSWQKCVAFVRSSLENEKSVVIDNTNPDVESRKRYVDLAKRACVPIRCFVMNVSKDHARHNNRFREFQELGHSKISDMIYNMYKAKYSEPQLQEGFEEIVKVSFIPKFKTKEDEKMYRMFLLEK